MTRPELIHLPTSFDPYVWYLPYYGYMYHQLPGWRQVSVSRSRPIPSQTQRSGHPRLVSPLELMNNFLRVLVGSVVCAGGPG